MAPRLSSGFLTRPSLPTIPTNHAILRVAEERARFRLARPLEHHCQSPLPLTLRAARTPRRLPLIAANFKAATVRFPRNCSFCRRRTRQFSVDRRLYYLKDTSSYSRRPVSCLVPPWTSRIPTYSHTKAHSTIPGSVRLPRGRRLPPLTLACVIPPSTGASRCKPRCRWFRRLAGRHPAGVRVRCFSQPTWSDRVSITNSCLDLLAYVPITLRLQSGSSIRSRIRMPR